MSVAAVCPGSYDPITLAHLDVIERVASCFDRVVVAVVSNPNKQGLFTLDERLSLIAEVTGHLDNVAIDQFSGLLVDYCVNTGVRTVVKGVRGIGDIEYEQQMAAMNRQVGGVETLLMPTAAAYAHVSSSLVKEVARLGGSVEGTVPPPVARALAARLAEQAQ